MRRGDRLTTSSTVQSQLQANANVVREINWKEVLSVPEHLQLLGSSTASSTSAATAAMSARVTSAPTTYSLYEIVGTTLKLHHSTVLC